METCTQRPTWADFLPSSASRSGLFSMGCPFPSSTTSSPITTASSKRTSTRPSAGSGERWTLCREPQRRWRNVYREATHSPPQGKRAKASLGHKAARTRELPSFIASFKIMVPSGSKGTCEACIHKERSVQSSVSRNAHLDSNSKCLTLLFNWIVFMYDVGARNGSNVLDVSFSFSWHLAQYVFLDLNWLEMNFPSSKREEGLLIFRRIECYRGGCLSFGVRSTSKSESQLHQLRDLC